MTAQLTTLAGVSQVPSDGATLTITTAAAAEWAFTDGVPGSTKSYVIQVFGNQAWLYGTEADNVIIPVAANIPINVTVRSGRSFFAQAATSNGTLYFFQAA